MYKYSGSCYTVQNDRFQLDCMGKLENIFKIGTSSPDK